MILIIQWSAMFDPAHNLNTKNPKHGDHNVNVEARPIIDQIIAKIINPIFIIT